MNSEQRYQQALDYLFSYVDYSLKHTDELVRAEFNLERMVDLMHLLGDPQNDYPIIHVAGTKGKGSTSAFLASAMEQAGYSTGLYTSPHLVDFCERIQVDDSPISHPELADLVQEIKPYVNKVPFITTFELTTALSFLYFSRRKVNAAVIEVGMGGRLDATNIVNPVVSVITSISLDHTAVLGNTVALIAAEKAGIIKKGIPVVSSPQVPEALEVIRKIADQRDSPLTLVGVDWMFAEVSSSLDGQDFKIWQKGKEALNFSTGMLGLHQVQNAATAYAALQIANQNALNVSEEAIRSGFKKTFWPARFEVVRRDPPIILDSAHNMDSFIKLHDTLDEYFPGKKVILIFGASEDKDIATMLTELKPRLRQVILTKSTHPRALDPEVLAKLAEELEIPYLVLPTVPASFEEALLLAEKEEDIILSAGSIFVTAEVRISWLKFTNAWDQD
ncbi:MAG TPA: folylpolyglutamate synthase/dihydrofolate synthase family protein [Anaerolineales bacterium]|nr:folylpolyglutamate synthase/dihydrofolate synthase family protein [Anaerolineales bacterium]